MIIIIDFDDFIDNIDYFSELKTNLPHFIAFFKGKNIASCDDKDNFIPLIISKIEQIHTSYVNKIMQVFNQKENNEEGEENKKEYNVNNNNNEEDDKEENNNEEDDEEENNEEENNDEDNGSDEESIVESIEDNKSEIIRKEKDRLKKIKELKKLQQLLKK
jgi:hypothetical protein